MSDRRWQGMMCRLEDLLAGRLETTGNEPEEIQQIVEGIVRLRRELDDLEKDSKLLGEIRDWACSVASRETLLKYAGTQELLGVLKSMFSEKMTKQENKSRDNFGIGHYISDGGDPTLWHKIDAEPTFTPAATDEEMQLALRHLTPEKLDLMEMKWRLRIETEKAHVKRLAHANMQINSDLGEVERERNDLRNQVRELKSQLPAGMQNRTIILHECPVGHYYLRGNNWSDQGCNRCKIVELERKLEASSNAEEDPF